MRVLLLTSAALVAFAANSLLTRGALESQLIDAPAFTVVRVATGALMLILLLRLRPDRPAARATWTSAATLSGYAVAFTLAYTRIGAAMGALLLIGAVQVTMVAGGIARGERPRAIDWIGMAFAAVGLFVLTLPGATAPDVVGAALMLAGGVCWGVYSLAGQDARDPLASTAANFARATVLTTLALLWFLRSPHVTAAGLLLATTSGALASGVGYTLWYAALPALASWRAALVQLAVPILTALGAVVLLHEAVGPRLVPATALIAAGVWLSTRPARR